MIIKYCFLDVLAINTHLNKRAFSINPRGGYHKVDFEFGDTTEVDRSCSIQWQNYYFVFGGFTQKRQVSVVNGNRLERKGSLAFDFNEGGCTVLNQITIVLCFATFGEQDVCRQSNNPLGSFTKLPNSNFNHYAIRLASFNGKNTIYWKIKTQNFRYTHRSWIAV